MNRILFGHETRLEILAATCPGCGAQRGSYHEYGCPLETCPQCGGRLLKCRCKALGIYECLQIARAVAATLDKKSAWQIINRARNEGCPTCSGTYEQEGAFKWLMDHASPAGQRFLEEQAMKMLGAERDGDFFRVPLNRAAEVLGMSKEDAAPIMAALEAECLYPGWDNGTGEQEH